MQRDLPSIARDFPDSAKQALRRLARKCDATEVARCVYVLRRLPKAESLERLDSLISDLEHLSGRLTALDATLDLSFLIAEPDQVEAFGQLKIWLDELATLLHLWRRHRAGKRLHQSYRFLLSAYLLAITGKPHDREFVDLWTAVEPDHKVTVEAVRKARQDYAELIENTRQKLVERYGFQNRT